MKKRKILLDRELRYLNEIRSLHDEKKLKHGDPLSFDDIDIVNSLREEISRDRFQLGRKVVQKKNWFGLQAGRVGWVTSEWPRTVILFSDGRECDVHVEFAEILEPQEDFVKDIDDLRKSLLEFNRKKKR